MKRAFVIAAMAAAAMAAGCGKKSEPAPGVRVTTTPGGGVNYTAKSATGERVDVVTGSGAAALANVKLPGYLPLYPGASVQSSVTGGGASGSGGTVMFTTPAKPADVVAFYKDKAAAAGFTTNFSSQSGDGLMFTAAKEAGGEGMQVIATPAGGTTSVQLVWSNPKAQG